MTTIDSEEFLAGLRAGLLDSEAADAIEAMLILLAKYTAEQRREMAKDGRAMPDGGYPIGDGTDLDRAISAVGRGSGSHNEIRRHIMKNARRLGQAEKIPDNWNPDGSMKAATEFHVEPLAPPEYAGNVEAAAGILAEIEAGGDPSKGTARDRRLRENKNKTMQADHPYVDTTGSGTCDVCGMPEEEHAPMMEQTITETLAADEAPVGIPFRIPFMAQENLPTGDGRMFKNLDLSAGLPQPLSTQFALDSGHDGAVVTGRFTALAKDENGRVSGEGVYLLTEDGLKAARLAAEKAMPGFSINGDQVGLADMDEDGNTVYETARLRGGTQCMIPAFVETGIEVDIAEVEAAEAFVAARGDAVVAEVEEMLVASAVAAIGRPQSSWFNDPGFGDPETDARLQSYLGRDGRHAGYAAPLTTDARTGRVEGHIAPWNMCHTGYTDRCVKAPPSASGYAFFHRGEMETASGEIVPVGVLTFEAGHADPSARGLDAMAHYDNSATICAYGRVGEDQHGVWFSGILAPDLTPAQVMKFRALGASGDWRREGGALELIGAHMVPTEGFPQLRTMVADGRCQTLIASSAVFVSPERDALVGRVDLMEAAIQPLLAQARDALLADLD